MKSCGVEALGELSFSKASSSSSAVTDSCEAGGAVVSIACVGAESAAPVGGECSLGSTGSEDGEVSFCLSLSSNLSLISERYFFRKNSLFFMDNSNCICSPSPSPTTTA